MYHKKKGFITTFSLDDIQLS